MTILPPPADEPPPAWAIVLSGGRGSRLGGTSKAALEVDGVTLLDGVLDALAGAGIGATRVVVVGDGPTTARPGLTLTREEPPFGGPLAGLAAGLELVPTHAQEVLALACDLPRAARLVARLMSADPAHAGGFGTVVTDADGRAQWLAGRYRRAPLSAAVERARAARGTLTGASLHGTLGALPFAMIDDDDGASADIDTPADLARARERGTKTYPVRPVGPHEGEAR